MSGSVMLQALRYYSTATGNNQLKLGINALKSVRNLLAVIGVAGVLGFLATRFPYELLSEKLIEGLSIHYLLVVAMLLEITFSLLTKGGLSSLCDGLRFNHTETEFFFASPLTRRQVVLFKLLNIQKLSLLGVIPLTVVSPVVFESLSSLRMLPGLLVVVTLLVMSYFLLRYFISYCAMVGHLYISRVVLLAVIGAIGYNGWQVVTEARTIFSDLSKFNQTPAFELFSAPIDWLIAPVISDSWVGFGQTVWMPLLLCIGLIGLFFSRKFHFALFESKVAGAGRSQQQPTQTNAAVPEKASQKTARTAPKMAAIGPQYKAVVWKSIMADPMLRSPVKCLSIAVALVAMVALSGAPLPMWARFVVGTVEVSFLVSLFLIGPWLFRGGLRRDMPYLDLLKSMPISAWQLIFGGMVIPVVATFMLLVLLGVSLVLVLSPPMISVALNEQKLFLLLVLLPFAFSLIVSRFTIHNLLALHLPSFVSFDQNSGDELYRMFFRGVISVVVFIAMFFPALMAVGLLFSQTKLLPGIPPQWLWAIAVNIGALVLLAESTVLLYFSQSRYQHFDISQENNAR